MKSKTKIFNIILALLLTLSVFAFNSVKVEAYDGSETDTTGWIQPWTHFGSGGNVEWAIDPEETLWIRPENGVSVGIMGYISSTSYNRMPWYSKVGNIASVKIKSGATIEAPANSSYMFYSVGKTGGTIDLTELDTSKVTSMNSMFASSQATTLDLSSFDTSSVNDMTWMFGNSQITLLDLSSFDTSNVTSMMNMFYNSWATTVNLSSFNTSKVTNMYGMFWDSLATSLDLSSFDTSSVTDMGGMFYSSRATTLGLNSFNTSKVTNMNGMFSRSQATTLDVSSFNTSNVTNMSNMFYDTQATTLDLSNFDTSNVTSMQSMFAGSQAISLDLSNFDTSKVTDMVGMFSRSQATTLDLSNFDTSNVTRMGSMFNGSKATTIIGLDNFDTSKVTTMYKMFSSSQATILDISSFNTSNVTSMYDMFRESQATTLDLSNFDTSSVTNMSNMFYNSKTTKLTLSEVMGGNNGSRFSNTSLSGSDWVKVRDKNGNLILDETQYTASQIMLLTESTTPKLSGTWVKKSSPEYQAEIDKGQEYISKQGINTLNEWVKNGNIWTYTFDVFDDQIPYYIWEDIIPGYKSSIMKPRRDYFNENGEKYYEIINVSTDRASLEISKVVEGIETDQKFNLTIKINDWPGTFVKSGIVFTDGVANIKLGHGETKLIEGLPSNKTFIVSEQEVSPFVSSSTGESGTLSKGQKSEVAFTNTWVDPKIETPENFDNVKIKKLVDGKYETSGKYTFYISLTNLAANTTYELSNGEAFTSDTSGNANVNVELEANEELIIKYLPVGSHYQITEQAGNYTSAYVITGSENLNANQSTGNSTGEQQQLSTSLERVDSNEEAVVTFTNTLTKSESIKVKKLVNGTEADKLESFSFILTLDNLEPYGKYDTSIGRFVADEDGWLQKEFSLKDSEEVVIENLPIGATYQVTEKKNHLAASYLIEDANGLDLINLSDNQNEEKNKDLSTAVETVNEGEDVTITFTNTRNTVLVTLKKIVDGNMGNKNDIFNFTVQINDRQPVSYQLSHNEQVEIEIPLNAQYTISEQDYSSEGYRTYVNNKLFQTRVFEDTATEDKDVTFKNIKGAIVPTGISLYLQTGIPIIILVSILFLFRKKIGAFIEKKI